MGVLSAFKRWSETGIKFPLMYDPASGKPSITMLFPYVSFILAMIAIVLLLKENTLYGTIAAIGTWLLALVLYLMRRITKIKADVKNESIEIDGGDSDETKSNSNS